MTSENNEQSTTKEAAPETTKQNVEKPKKVKKLTKPENEIPRGKPKSNRPWKTPKTK